MPSVLKAGYVPNALVKKLEAGNGSVKGLKLLVAIDGRCLMACEVIGIDFGGYARNGVAVLVKPAEGYGTLSVSAYDLLDNTPAARKQYEAQAGAAEYLRLHTPRDGASDKAWREAVMRERAALTNAQRKRFDTVGRKHFRENLDMIAGIKEASSYTLEEVFKAAVMMRFELPDEACDSED